MEIVQVDSSTCPRKYNLLLETKSLKINLIFLLRETDEATRCEHTFEKFH